MELRRTCDPDTFDFETTANLPALTGVLGQPRAVAALSFGASIASHGFNLFAMGQPGSGKTTLIREYLERRAAAQSVPDGYCYVYNFANPRCPLPLKLPAGRAAEFRKDIDDLMNDLLTEMGKAFESDEYSAHRDRIVHDLEEKRREELERIEEHVKGAGFQLLKGPAGLILAPATGGKPLTEEQLELLGPEERATLARTRERLQREIEDRFRAVRDLEKATRDDLRKLDTEAATFATHLHVDEVRARYSSAQDVLDYLDALQADVIAHSDDFRKGKDAEGAQAQPAPLPLPAPDKPLARYRVNVLVDNGAMTGAPVVVESNPTYHNLIGRIEHVTAWGGAFTDHTMIKPGALHRANGGYLIIPARECLMNPMAWDGLKRALKDRAVRIEEAGSQLGLVSTVSLDPEPIPLDVKVVLIGSPAVYHMLYVYDEDFQKLFKVKAEFTTSMKRNADSEKAYAVFANAIARSENAMPFDRSAVARIVEYGSRLADDQDELSTRFGEIADLIREASHLAKGNSHAAATGADVRVAEEARRYRQNLVEERVQESYAKGMMLVEVSGAAVGRVNGLSVIGVGDYSFGHPVRLTAATGPGRRGVVSIEREVELSGPIHGKGVLILSGYLLARYGATGPLSVSASLVFEQSYGMVDGDSASMAELCVLISSIAGVPLRQDVAITGSVNQHGDAQAVGGVTEKVEGFFDLCRSRGLTGSQGVVLPFSNRRNLMLRDEIVEAAAAGDFHIWAAATLDEALELLTGLPAPEVDKRVEARLAEYSELLRTAGGDNGKKAAGA